MTVPGNDVRLNNKQLMYAHYQTCMNILKCRKYLSSGQEVILCVPQPKWSEINACFDQRTSSSCRVSTGHLDAAKWQHKSKIISSESSTFCKISAKPEGGVHHLSRDTTEKASLLNQKLNHVYLFQTFTTQ